MDLKPTEEQAAIIEAVAGKDSVMVSAYAGCAKTSTLQMAGKGVRVPALALAFNRSIANEIGGKLPQNFTVKTINGFGYGAWAKAVQAARPGASLQLEDKKLGKLVSQVAKEFKVDLNSDQWAEVRQLVSSAMQAGLTPDNEGEPLTDDSPDTWRDLADGLWISEDDFPFEYEVAREVLKRNIALAREGIVSFDDQVYCPVVLGGKFIQFPQVFVDEAQDLSPLNHAMLAKAVRPDGRLVVVGDPKQAIYAFRGASSESMARIAGLKPNWTRLPLAITFRCPKTVVARQQEHAPGYRAWPSNPDGRVDRFQRDEDDEGKATELSGWTVKKFLDLAPNGSSRVAILCRNNAPLMGMAFRLLRAGIGVTYLGRDIGKSLIALSRKIVPVDETERTVAAAMISEWAARESDLARANGHDEKVAGIYDRAECLQAVLSHAEAKDAGQMRGVLERLFDRDSGQITLGSIHRAKGLEWDLVMHLDPWRIPSKWARQAAEAGDKTQLEQEFNLRYVCETRTRHTLVMANFEDFAG